MELKFRLIRDAKIVGYEVHEYDKITNTFYIFHNKDTTPGYNICAVEEAFIPHDSKEQYTGLRDANGKDIYEGEIIVIHHRHKKGFGSKSTFLIESNLSDWGYEFTWRNLTGYGCSTHIMQSSPCNYEIIGNINENPELILDKQK